MSERERWIVYPLLFFALGAAVRDKILHRVDSKEIYCESLKIVDQQDPTGRAFVELSITRSNSSAPGQAEGRVGTLQLVDSTGRAACYMDSNKLAIIDQQEPKNPAVAELSIKSLETGDPTRPTDRVGLLLLKDSEGEETCRVGHQAFLPYVVSRRLDVVDAKNQIRAIATTEPGPGVFLPNGEETMNTQGVIFLNNQRVGTLKLAPPKKPRRKPKQLPSTQPEKSA